MSETILHFPDFTAGNPYQSELMSELNKTGVKAVLSRGYPHSLMLDLFNHQPDIVHIHWVSHYTTSKYTFMSIIKSAIFLLFLLLLKAIGIGIVWTIHNTFTHDDRDELVEARVRRYIYRISDEVIIHCEATKDEIASEYSITDFTKTNTIQHGNYIDSYNSGTNQHSARQKLDLPEDDLIFLFFGSIRRYKNVHYLAKKFMSKRASDSRLVIAGNPSSNELREEISKIVVQDPQIHTVFEFIPEDQIHWFFEAADVVILPFDQILTSGTVHLAMSFGKPIVAPSIGCLPNDLKNQQELLYNSESEFENLIGNIKRYNLEELGAKNQQEAKSRSWGEIASQTSKVYTRVNTQQ